MIVIVEINFIWVEGNIKSNYCYIIIKVACIYYLMMQWLLIVDSDL